MGLEKLLSVGFRDCSLALSPYATLSFSAAPEGRLSGMQANFTDTYDEFRDIDRTSPLAQLFGWGEGGPLFAPALFFPPQKYVSEDYYHFWSLHVTPDKLSAVAGRLALESDHAYQAVQQQPKLEYTASWFLLHAALCSSRAMLAGRSFSSADLEQTASTFAFFSDTQQRLVLNTAEALDSYAPLRPQLRNFMRTIVELHYSP